jgi:hypothetical protein
VPTATVAAAALQEHADRGRQHAGAGDGRGSDAAISIRKVGRSMSEAETSIDSVGRDFRIDEDHRPAYVTASAEIGALRRRWRARGNLDAERTVLRTLLRGCNRLRE